MNEPFLRLADAAEMERRERRAPSPPQGDAEDRLLTELRAELFAASSLAGLIVPARDWYVDGFIPARTVTILGGDGATGKSLVALQLAAATTAGKDWLGKVPRQGRCLFITAEDSRDEVHRRLADISRETGTDISSLPDLFALSLEGKDALLAITDPKTNVLRPTDLYRCIGELIREFRPALLVLDTLANLFGGEENNRAHTLQFISLLQRWAVDHDVTILLLAHPSLAGMSSGTGSSGSTSWNNGVRSRLYLERVKGPDGSEEDTNARVLSTRKANYAPANARIDLHWQRGVFVPKNALANDLERASAEAKAEQAFLDLLEVYRVEGRNVGATTSSIYAPKVFPEDQRSRSLSKQTLQGAMNCLFAAGKITVVETGPPSHRRSKIVLTDA